MLGRNAEFARRLSTVALGAIAVACANPPRPAALAPRGGPDPIERFLAGRSIIYGHLQPSANLGDSVRSGMPIGIVDSIPPVQSARHQGNLTAARDLYSQGRFLDAVGKLRLAVRDEPENPFLLSELGRALFRIDSLKPESRATYVRLVSLLDAAASAPPGAVVVDLWFVDAYWKLALLDLDAEDYRGALLQLAKVTLAPHPNTDFEEQLFGYLAETFYHLGDRQAARWFADRTLRLNSRNQYVLPFRD